MTEAQGSPEVGVRRHHGAEALGLGLWLLLLAGLALELPGPPLVPGRQWLPDQEELALLDLHWQRELAGPSDPADPVLLEAWTRLQGRADTETLRGFLEVATAQVRLHGQDSVVAAGRRLALELDGALAARTCDGANLEGDGRLAGLALSFLGQAKVAGAFPRGGDCSRGRRMLLRLLYLRSWLTLAGLDPAAHLHFVELRLLGRWLVEASESLDLDERVQRAQVLVQQDPRFPYLFTTGVLAVREGRYDLGRQLLLASIARREGPRDSAGRLLWILSLNGLLE